MFKRIYVIHEGKPCEIVIRNYTENDSEALIDVQRQSFPPPFPEDLWWNKDQIISHTTLFPEGALCAEYNGKIIGSITGLIIKDEDYETNHRWSVVTDDGYIRNHNREGDTLYIVDVCVIPPFRKSGIGKWLMQSMYETVVHLGLVRLAGGGRMPGYHNVASTMSAEQYLQHIIDGSIFDPVISFLLRCGRVPVKVIENYLEDDESLNYATIMEWRNPFLTQRRM